MLLFNDGGSLVIYKLSFSKLYLLSLWKTIKSSKDVEYKWQLYTTIWSHIKPVLGVVFILLSGTIHTRSFISTFKCFRHLSYAEPALKIKGYIESKIFREFILEARSNSYSIPTYKCCSYISAINMLFKCFFNLYLVCQYEIEFQSDI